jgi:hypothetical protein
VEQIHKIFKLCGSPSDDYWKKLEVLQTGTFKPSRQYARCLAETFKGFSPSALVLLDNLLALEPEARGTAASTLQSDVSLQKKFWLLSIFILVLTLPWENICKPCLLFLYFKFIYMKEGT